MSQQYNHHEPKKKKKKVGLIVFLSILGVVLLAAGGLIWYTVGTYHHVNLDESQLGITDVSAFHKQLENMNTNQTIEEETTAEGVKEEKNTAGTAVNGSEETCVRFYSARARR